MKKQNPGLLPVSQRDLAAYLGISVTLLSMTNTGRHGARQLGPAPSLKMAALLLAHVQAQKPHPPGPTRIKMQKKAAETCHSVAKVMQIDARYATHHVPLLRNRLNEMRSAQQQDMEWLNTLELLFARLASAEEPKGDKIWLEHQKELVLKRLQKNGLSAQVKLEVQIEMEEARARIYKAAQERLQEK